MSSVPVQNRSIRRFGRPVVIAAGVAVAALLSGCNGNDLPPARVPASGITSSNGGGMRQTGAIPDVGVSNGVVTTGTMPANPRVPRY